MSRGDLSPESPEVAAERGPMSNFYPAGTLSTCKRCHSTLIWRKGEGWQHVYPQHANHDPDPDERRLSLPKEDAGKPTGTDDGGKEERSPSYRDCVYLPKVCCSWFQAELMEGGILTYDESEVEGKLRLGVYLIYPEGCPWGPRAEQIQYCPRCGRCVGYKKK